MDRTHAVDVEWQGTIGFWFGHAVTWRFRTRVVMDETPHVLLPSPHPALRCVEETPRYHAAESAASPDGRTAGLEETVRLNTERKPPAVARLKAGIEELFAQGHATVSIPDVMAHTGMSRSTVHTHWKTLAAMPDVELVIETIRSTNGRRQNFERAVLQRKAD